MKKQRWMAGALLPILIMALIVSGCGTRETFKGDPATGITLQWGLDANKSLQYRSGTDANINMEMMGRTMEIKNISDMVFDLAYQERDNDGNLRIKTTIDSLYSHISSMQGDITIDASKVLGKSFIMIMNPHGKPVEFEGDDSLVINMGQMSGGQRQVSSMLNAYLPGLPEKEVKIGDSWTSSQVDTVRNMGMEMLNKATSTYTVEGLEMVNGHECLKIVSKSKGSVEGGGSTMGQNMNTEGDTESERVIYFDFRKGFVVKYTFNSFMEGTVAVSGQANMTIPMVNETKISMQLIK